MVAYNYSGEKVVSAKMPHIGTRFYNKLCKVSEKGASFFLPAILKEHKKSAFGSKQ